MGKIMNSAKSDFNIGANAGRKYDEKVIADIGGKNKDITVMNLDEKAKKVIDKIQQGEKDILALIKEDVVSEMDVSGLKHFVDPNLKLSCPSKEEVDKKQDGEVLIFPNFTGGKYIGGKNYNFTKGKGIYVPPDVRDVLSRGKKILIK